MQKNKQIQKTKMTTREITCLCIGIILCIFTLAFFLGTVIIPNAINAGKYPSPHLGLTMWGTILSVIFGLPAFLIGLGLIIYSILCHKKADKPGLTTFGIIIALILVIGLIFIAVLLAAGSR